ncbi:hypothetical protein KBD45_02640 [Candidatus Dojkabacteria bacterium]|nr:hypothetical protein [Candidatus Dojkabacteria bacterium]
MKDKALIAGSMGLVTFSVFVGLGLQNAFAYKGDATKVGPYHTEEREVAMDKVMVEKDFEGWKNLMTEDGRNPGVLIKIDTQAEFEKFAEAHGLIEEGKIEEANAIRTELGLGQGQGQGKGQGQGQKNGQGRGQNNKGMHVDLDNNGVCDRQE